MEDSNHLTGQVLQGVEIGYWNPSREDGTTIDNFGDLIGPLIIRAVLEQEKCVPRHEVDRVSRLLGVGSVMHYARPGDTIWGAGVNGKHIAQIPNSSTVPLDIRAVRGPWTAAALSTRGHIVPEVFGDPGLLVAEYLNPGRPVIGANADILLVPNLHDYPNFAARRADLERRGIQLLAPTLPINWLVNAIADAKFVVGSSLHAIVVADSFRIGSRMIRSAVEPDFKYIDYLLGTERSVSEVSNNLEEAITAGPQPSAVYDRESLLGAFPTDLWESPKQEYELPPAKRVNLPEPVLRLFWDRATGRKGSETILDEYFSEIKGSTEVRNEFDMLRKYVVPDLTIDQYRARIQERPGTQGLSDSGGSQEHARIIELRNLGSMVLVSFEVALKYPLLPDSDLSLEIDTNPCVRDPPLPLTVSHTSQVYLELDVLFSGKIVESIRRQDVHILISDRHGARRVPLQDHAVDHAGRG